MTDAPQQPLIESDPQYGEAIDFFPINRLRLLIVGALIGAPIALLLGVLAASIDAWWVFPIVVAGTAALAWGLGWYVLHYWNREIILYVRGLSYREGSQLVFFEYDEIASLRLKAERVAYAGGLVRDLRYRAVVTTYGGDRFVLTERYKRIDTLTTRLSAQVMPLIAQRVRQRMAIGDRVPFGDSLLLDRGGMSADARRLAWADFDGWRIHGGQIALYHRDGSVWETLPLSETDNITLLIDLFREMGHAPRA